MREAVPHLRIVDDGLWAAVQARKGELTALPATHGSEPKRLLSRLMFCGICGSTMVLGGAKYACSRAREKGTCANIKIIAATTVEARVLDGIRRHLLAPRGDRACDPIDASAQGRGSAGRHAPAGAARARAGDVARRLARTQDLYVAGQIEMNEVKRRNAPLSAKREEIRSRLAQADMPAPPSKVVPIAVGGELPSHGWAAAPRAGGRRCRGSPW